MFNPIADTCHCLVRHPEKPKFLVVKHEESWAPPTLSFPRTKIDFKVKSINQGMLDKYGLKTRVLRPIINLPSYHCIEMELASAQSSKKLEAVWVDQAEYMRSRNPPGDVPDPFELWFQEQDSGQVPSNRPLFHQPGWYDQAEHWIQFQLDSLGIQVTGSVEQFRQGWTFSCILRVATNQGWIYFKAGHETGTGEAALTNALAQHWPDVVERPLAIDAKKNWLLNRDLRPEGNKADARQFPHFAASLARLQLESCKYNDEWKAQGCKEITLDDFIALCKQPEVYRHRWQEGGGGLTDQEWSEFLLALGRVEEDCKVLAEIDLPLTLVHPDFRNENLGFVDGNLRLFDWSGVVITHPFLVLGRIFKARSYATESELDSFNQQPVIDAYLQAFNEFSSQEDLLRALAAAEKLNWAWSMLRLIHKIEQMEPRTPHYYLLVVGLQSISREFIGHQAG